MPQLGRKVAAINMDTNFQRIRMGDAAFFKCIAHKDIPPMTRKQARKHYMEHG